MQVEHETETQCNPTATILGATGHRIVKFEYIPTGTARQESDSIEARRGDERSKSLKGLTQASLVNVDRKRRVKPKRAAAAQLAALIRALAVAAGRVGKWRAFREQRPAASRSTAHSQTQEANMFMGDITLNKDLEALDERASGRGWERP